ncbi:MAG: sigma-70 family RNA polymerase sigma factor [Vicingaceae bacterium]
MEAISELDMTQQDEQIKEAIEKEGGRLLNFIRKRIPDPIEAEDLLQDVFYEFIDAYRMLKPIEQTTSWLFAVARNKITDLFRKKKPISFSAIKGSETEIDDEKWLPVLLLESSETIEDEMIKNLLLEELDEAIAALPEDQRWAFVQHEIEGLSFKEMSFLSGDGVNTLISRKRYAVMNLRESLQEIYHELLINN